MHFSKAYSQLLLTLPPELQENAIEYRQLKRLINKLVGELASIGLNPSVLQTLLGADEVTFSSENGKGKHRALDERSSENLIAASVDHHETRSGPGPRPSRTKAVYEVVQDGEHIHPRLRIKVDASESKDSVVSVVDNVDLPPGSPPSSTIANAPESAQSDEEHDAQEEDLTLVARPVVARPGQSLIWTLQRSTSDLDEEQGSEPNGEIGKELGVFTHKAHPAELLRRHFQISEDGTREFIIPLQSDMAFFELLYSALQTLTSHLSVVRSNFISRLDSLARTISNTARPQSALPNGFHAWSSSSDPRSVYTPLISPFSTAFIPGNKAKSDLYSWREIFQLYLETEVFESVHEMDRGERSIAEAEKRLALFAEQVTARGLNDRRKLRVRESRDALETFLQLNVFILNLKKFQYANAEAARKILKKHAKRTALPFPIPDLETTTTSSTVLQVKSQVFSILRAEHSGDHQRDILTLIPTSTTSLPHILVQAIGETLLPIIPHLDDYSCLICTSIAFKPIRLDCGHLFCVRCLITMQKRGQDHCPCCRAPCILKADRSNVDWAMLNFMQDWFPREAKLKLKQNEEETAKEQMEELGIPDTPCVVA